MKPEQDENSSVGFLFDITADIFCANIFIIDGDFIFIYEILAFRKGFCGITGIKKITAKN